jgi:hypothetical protein
LPRIDVEYPGQMLWLGLSNNNFHGEGNLWADMCSVPVQMNRENVSLMHCWPCHHCKNWFYP